MLYYTSNYIFKSYTFKKNVLIKFQSKLINILNAYQKYCQSNFTK